MNIATSAPPGLLITGASGLLGSALCDLAVPRWTVYGICNRYRPQIKGVRFFQVDLTRWDETGAMLRRLQPKAVIHAAAVADVAQCQRHPKRTAEINIQVPNRLAAWCAQRGVPYAFISTDLVFDGTQAPYDETHPVNPINQYGYQKAQAEKGVIKAYSKAAIFRLPLMIGVSSIFPQRKTHHFCQQMLQAIETGNPLPLFFDEYRTPVDIDSAAKGILELMDRIEGIVHMGGCTRISRYELGLMMAAAMRRSPDSLQAVSIKENRFAGSRAGDVSLNSRRAFGMGFVPSPLEAAVQQVVGQYLVISNS